MTTEQAASILKTGFLLGYFNKSVISQWAEKKILMGYENNSMIELVLVENKSNNEVLSLIGLLAACDDVYDKEFLDQYYFGLFNDALLMDDSESNWMAIENEVLRYAFIEDRYVSEDHKFFISMLDNDYSLRKQGYSGEMRMPDQLLDFLRPYDKFRGIQAELDLEGIPKPVF